jgi:3-isopropylmalate dehydrogenase
MSKGRVSPTVMTLTTAMMLDWLAERHDHTTAGDAAQRIEAAIDRVFAQGLRPCEFGGFDGTTAIAKAVLTALEQVPSNHKRVGRNICRRSGDASVSPCGT